MASLEQLESAEANVIGNCLNGRTEGLLRDALSTLTMNHFAVYAPVWRAIIDLHKEEAPITVETVATLLKERNQLERLGGKIQLFDLSWLLPYQYQYYKSVLIAHLASKEISEILSIGTPQALIEASVAAKAAIELTGTDEEYEFYTADQVLPDIMERLSSIGQTDSLGLNTHLTGLNKFMRMAPGELIIIAARTSEGKSSLLLNLAEHISFELAHRVLMYSVEMTKEDIFERQLLSRAGIDKTLFFDKITREKIEWNRIVQASHAIALKCHKLLVLEKTPINISKIRDKSIAENKRQPVALIAVDYLGLISPEGNRKNGTREQDVSAMTRGLKLLAKELKVPVIVACQLSRDIDKSESNRKPRLSDLRESGAIEQDADIVIFIHHPKGENKEGIAELIIAKNRRGSKASIEVSWRPTVTRFDNLERG